MGVFVWTNFGIPWCEGTCGDFYAPHGMLPDFGKHMGMLVTLTTIPSYNGDT